MRKSSREVEEEEEEKEHIKTMARSFQLARWIGIVKEGRNKMEGIYNEEV